MSPLPDDGVAYDPENRQVIDPRPQGKIHEMEAAGLDPTRYGSCAPRNKITGVVGCSEYHRCRMSFRGDRSPDVGPENMGVEIIKAGSTMPIPRNTVDCMWVAQHRDDIVDNGGAITVLALGGESYEKVTTVIFDPVTGKECTQYQPGCQREERQVEIRVPKYPRPGQQPKHLHEGLKSASREKMKEELEREQRARAYGLRAEEPLDAGRPAVRAGKGKKPEGVSDAG